MTPPPIPRDCVGNELLKDAWVAVHLDRPFLYKIVAVENGGIHTASGITPALIRLFSDITLRSLPGLPFQSLVRVVEPGNQAIIEGLAGSLPRA